MVGKTVRGCSCRGGKSHECQRSVATTPPLDTVVALPVAAAATPESTMDLLGLLHAPSPVPVPASSPASEAIKSILDSQTDGGYVVCVRSFSRPQILKAMTLKVLEEVLTPAELQRVLIVLSPEDRTKTPTQKNN